MNRRSLLKGLVGVTASTFVVPELLLPEKKIWALGGVEGFNTNLTKELFYLDDVEIPVVLRDDYQQLVMMMKRDIEMFLIYGGPSEYEWNIW